MQYRRTVVSGDNITLIVPNADRLSARIVNWSRGDPRVRLRVPVGLAYGSGLAFRGTPGLILPRDRQGAQEAPA